MRKTQILINKIVNFSLSILDLSKMYKFWYEYVKKKQKHDENA